MHTQNDLLHIIGEVIMQHYGIGARMAFMSLTNNHFHGQQEGLVHLPMATQIDSLNAMWRDLLITKPDTTDIREWLVPSDDVSVYVNGFDQYWVHALWEHGVLGDGGITL